MLLNISYEKWNWHYMPLITSRLSLGLLLAPIGSVSSMEVNVDMLEQMDLMDISDQEALDVFLGSGGDEGVLASPLPGKGEWRGDASLRPSYVDSVVFGRESRLLPSSILAGNTNCNIERSTENLLSNIPLILPTVVHGNNNNDKVINQGRSLHYTDGCDGKFRVASTSSTNSQNTNEDGRDTQVIQSDDEDVHVDTVLLMGSPPGKDEEKNRSILSS